MATTWYSTGADVGSGGSGTIGSPSSITTCLTFASNGDTINIPSGTFTWNTGFNVNKAVTIIGQNGLPPSGPSGYGCGAINTTINITGNVNIYPVTGISTRFSGCKLSNTTGLNFLTVTGSSHDSQSDGIYRIDNCFIGTTHTDPNSPAGTLATLIGNGPGLIDHCTVSSYGGYETIHHLGANIAGAGAANDGWFVDITPGSYQAVYFENCLMTNNNAATTTIAKLVSCFYGARIVARNNFFTDGNIDCHGGNSVGTRWFEFYNNVFNNTHTNVSVFYVRAGSGNIFNNSSQAGANNGAIYLWCDNGSGGDRGSLVWGPGQGIATASNDPGTWRASPIYAWGNTSDPVNFVYVQPTQTGFIVQGQQYFSSATQPAANTMKIWQASSGAYANSTYTYTPFSYPYPLTNGLPNPSGGSTSTPSVPTWDNPSVTNIGTNGMTLNWIESTDAGSQYSGASITYTLQRKLGVGGTYSTIATPSGTGTGKVFYNDSGLSPNSTYYYQLNAYDPSGGAASGWSSSTNGTTSAASAGTATLVNHVNTSSNCYAYDTITLGYSLPGKIFTVYVVDPALSGNCLILACSYPNTAGTVAVADDKANTWTLAKSISNGTITSSIYVALGVIAGTRKVTVTFNTASLNCHFALSQFYNIAIGSLASVLDGSSSAATSGTSTLASGLFTPSTSGDLIYMYGYNTHNPTGITTNITQISSGVGFTFLSSDIMLGTFSQYQVQAVSGAINPTATISGGTDSYNVLSIALKTAGQGTAPASGIRVKTIQHVFYNRSIPITFPSSGNLLWAGIAFYSAIVNITSLTSPGNTWIETDQSGLYAPQCFYCQNAATGQGLTIMANGAGSGANSVTMVFYDIVGAASPVAFDKSVRENFANANSGNFNCCTLTPSSSNGLVIAALGTWYGYINASAQLLDAIWYTGEDNNYGSDWMDNCDGYAHYYNPTTASVTFNWGLNTAQTSPAEIGIAVAFKAPSGAVTTPTVPSWPANPITNITSVGMKITWNESTDVGSGYSATQLKYNLQRQTGGVGSFVNVSGDPISGTGTGSVSYNDTGLNPSTLYAYRVNAVDPSNSPSLYSSTISNSTLSPSFIPVDKVIDWTNAGIPSGIQLNAHDDRFGFATHFQQGWSTSLMPAIAATGAGWIRDDLSTIHWETSPGVYIIPASDSAWLTIAHQNGLKTCGVLGQNVNYANPYDPVAMANLSVWIAQSGLVDAIEVLNEPNNISTFNQSGGNALYVTLLQTVYNAVSAACPSVKVIGTDFQGSNELTVIGLLGSQFDGVVYHPYQGVGTDAIETVYEPSYTSYKLWVLAVQAATNKPIWETEWGVWGYVNDTTYTLNRQAINIARRMLLAAGLGVEHTFVYEYKDNGTEYFGVCDGSGVAKPAYNTVQNIISSLANVYPLGDVVTVNSVANGDVADVYAYSFQGNTNKTVVAYWFGNHPSQTPPASSTCSLTFLSPSGALSSTLTDSVSGISTSIEDNYTYSHIGNQLTISGLPISDTPQIIICQLASSSSWTIASTLNPRGGGLDDSVAIQTAIDSANATYPNGSVVLLNPGTFTINRASNIAYNRSDDFGAGTNECGIIIDHSNTVLRGSGPNNTIINYHGSNQGSIISLGTSFNPSTGSARVTALRNITSGSTKGSTSITVSNAVGISAGSIICVVQQDPTDTDGNSLCDVNGNIGGGSSYSGHNMKNASTGLLDYSMQQVCKVTHVNGFVLTLEIPLYFNFSNVPGYYLLPNIVHNSGLENLKVVGFNNIPSPNYQTYKNINLESCDGCWVTGCESAFCTDVAHIYLSDCYRCYVGSNYVHDALANYNGIVNASGFNYSICLQWCNSANLIENNIISKARHSEIMQGGGSGNVWGYNYDINPYMGDGLNYFPDRGNHAAHPFMNLWEGNEFPNMEMDFVHGSSSHNTFFRNYSCLNAINPNTGVNDVNGRYAMSIAYQNNYMIIVGNVLGPYTSANNANVYQLNSNTAENSCIYNIGYWDDSGAASPNLTLSAKVENTMIRGGNWDSKTGTVVWNSNVPSGSLASSYLFSQSMPISLYQSSKPSWFIPQGVYPSVDTASATKQNKIPARICYETQNLSSGGVFDPTFYLPAGGAPSHIPNSSNSQSVISSNARMLKRCMKIKAF